LPGTFFLPFSCIFIDLLEIGLIKRNNLTVLTNDKRLRQLAADIGVHGILWIFDCMLSSKIISRKRAVEKLHELMGINQRLPVDECLKRIKEWS
jgi:hypothetical protein